MPLEQRKQLDFISKKFTFIDLFAGIGGIRILKDKKPKAFMLENVRNLTGIKCSRFLAFTKTRKILKNLL